MFGFGIDHLPDAGKMPVYFYFAEHILNRSADSDLFPIDIEIYKSRDDAAQGNPAFTFKVTVGFVPVFDAQEV